MNKLFNEDIKERFLTEQYSNDSITTARYVFYYSYLNEMALNKDLFDLSLEEIGACISNSNPKSLSLAKSRGSIIKQYISWAIDINLRKSNINPLQEIDDEWYLQFVDEHIKQFISKQELDEIVNGLVNYQDKIIPVLLFYGVYGTESSEIRNLKLTDIQDDGTTRLYDDKKGERYIKLDEDVIDLLRKANYEPVYCSKNGVSASHRNAESELLDSDFIVKTVKRGRGVEGKRTAQMVIINRIDTIKEYFELPDLTPKSINRSGMLYLASQLIGDKDNLTQNDFDIISQQFNLSKASNNGYEYYNSSYLSSYINKENIKKLYGEIQ